MTTKAVADRISVGIVGGTGYTGVELLRLLSEHPRVDVRVITSRGEAGRSVSTLYPNLRGCFAADADGAAGLCFEEPRTERLAQCDLVFFATPHAVSMHMMPELIAAGVRVVDLSADFRLRDAQLWAQWYGEDHVCPELLDQAVYGLPEVNRAAIKDAQLVAAPGCYPTAVQLGLLPLLEQGLVDPDQLIANAASGVSGAGRQAKVDNLLSEVADSFKDYCDAGHRHLPEIEQGLSLAAKKSVQLTFVPHLLPIIRGIHATLYASLSKTSDMGDDDLRAIFQQRYADEPFVDVLPAGMDPQTRSVRGSNICRLAVYRPQGRKQVVVLSAIDNLTKGASGQAIQCMNIMLGIDENMGLGAPGLMP